MTQGDNYVLSRLTFHAGGGRHPGDVDGGGEFPAGAAAFGAVCAGGGAG